jgi:ferric-dicitrate binding protein FerR (iron transport regulator)
MTRDEQRQLLARACADELSPDEASRLLEACRRDPELLAELGRVTVVQRLLAHNQLYPDDGTFVREVSQRLAPAPAARRSVFRRRWPWAAAAALAAAGLWLAGDRGPDARVTRVEAVVWTHPQASTRAGDPVAGQRLNLAGGLAEVTFARGARMLVEGPAELEVRGPQHAFLHQGRAVIRLPVGTRGFVLESPRGPLVDQGTEFAVNVGASGDTEVHVLEGRVEARPGGPGPALNLTRDQAARLMPGNIERFSADAAGFVTDLPSLVPASVGFLHWSFDEGSGTASINRGQGLGQQGAAARLLTFPAGGRGPTWVQGQFGHGLSFNGRDDFVEGEFTGIGGTRARTVAFWVKVPRDFRTTEGYAIVNWGTMEQTGRAWQISINPMEKEGPLGRLRLGVNRGWVVGTTDLRDDRWHHCAVVMYGGHRPDAGTHILLYVDGELEPAGRKAVMEIRTATDTARAHNLWLGRNLNYEQLNWKVDGGPFFRGCLDEFFVFDAALDQERIRFLMKHNRLPPPSSPIAQADRP